MLCLHICYICKYLAYLCRVQKKQHWLSLSWESGCPGNRHKTGDLSLYPFVINSELCEDTNYSQEPDEVADNCNPGPREAETERFEFKAVWAIYNIFRMAWVIL